jgi:hypothetical protein
MLIKLVQVIPPVRAGGPYELTQIYVNPSQIVFLSENRGMKTKLAEGKIKTRSGETLNPMAAFTNIKLNENVSRDSEIVVIGSPSEIESKIVSKDRNLLFG